MLVKAFVIGSRTVDGDYTVFLIEVFVDGVKHLIERRYSEFEDLHKLLKRQIDVPQLPPKRINNKSAKVIEERKVHLESYLQEVLASGYLGAELEEFLGIEVTQFEQSHSQFPTGSEPAGSPPIAFSVFAADYPVIELQTEGSMQDIIIQGLYRAFYADI